MDTGRLVIAVLLLVVVGSLAPAQNGLFPGEFLPATGHLALGGSVEMSDGRLVDIDGDGDADAVGVSFGQSAFLVVPASGGTFPAPGAAYPSGYNPVDLAVADVDGDGDLDAFVLCYGTGVPQLWTYFNDGTGGFGATPLVRSLSTTFSVLKAARLNNDAIPDFAVADGNGYWTLLFGTGGGALGPEIPIPGQFGLPPVFVDDDGDGDDDLHVVAAAGLQTRRNDGSGVFAPPVLSAVLSPSVGFLAFADVDGNGTLDAVAFGTQYIPGNPFQAVAQVAFRSSAGAFTPGPLQLLANFGASYGPLLRDMNGDGAPDLIAYDPDSGFADDLVLISLNDGVGNFAPGSAIDFPGGMAWSGIDVGDVDADGRNDLAVFVNSRLVLYRNGPAGLVAPKNVAIGGTGGSLFRVTDLNRDGKPDVISVIGSGSTTALSIVLDVDSAAAPQIIPIGVAIQALVLGDWNRDGILDLLAASGPPISGLGLFLGNGTGGFGAPSFIPAGGNPVAVRAADVNGDGNLDILILNSQLSVLPGNGAGGFGPPIVTTVCSGTCVGNDAFLVGDLNNDGFVDVVVSHPGVGFNPATVGVYLGNGSGAFTLFTGSPFPPPGTLGAILEDVNGDGVLDHVQVTSGNLLFTVRIGLGTGGFAGPVSTSLIGPGSTLTLGGDLALGDVNGDGAPDAVLAGGAVLLNNGAGVFPSVIDHVMAYATKVAVADVDRNLQTDAVFFQPSRNRLAILRNLTPCTGTGFAFGLGGPGARGIVPRLSAFGLPRPGGTVTIRMDHALGGSPAALLVAPNPAIVPFGSGYVAFVDLATFVAMPISLVGPPVPGAGSASLLVVLPSLSGPIPAAAQLVVYDPASPLSYSTSNGMDFVVQ